MLGGGGSLAERRRGEREDFHKDLSYVNREKRRITCKSLKLWGKRQIKARGVVQRRREYEKREECGIPLSSFIT